MANNSTDNETPIFGNKQKSTPDTTPNDTSDSAEPIFGRKSTTTSSNEEKSIFDQPSNSADTTTTKSATLTTTNSKSTNTANTQKSTPAPNDSTNTTPETPILAAPRTPLNPKTKKKLLLAVIIGVVAVLAIAATIIVLLVLSHVDYKTAYTTADELNDEFTTLQSNSACSNVTRYANSTYASAKDYEKYVEKCRESGTDLAELVTKLSETSAIQKDSDLKEKFDKFKSAFDQTYLVADTSEALEVYSAWHNFVIAAYKLGSYSSTTDAEIKSAAAYLTDSNNSTLQSYGKEWLKLREAATAAYKAYYDASYSQSNYSELRQAYYDADEAYDDFIEDIDLDDVVEFNTDISDATSKFSKLYSAIRTKYNESKDD